MKFLNLNRVYNTDPKVPEEADAIVYLVKYSGWVQARIRFSKALGGRIVPLADSQPE